MPCLCLTTRVSFVNWIFAMQSPPSEAEWFARADYSILSEFPSDRICWRRAAFFMMDDIRPDCALSRFPLLSMARPI